MLTQKHSWHRLPINKKCRFHAKGLNIRDKLYYYPPMGKYLGIYLSISVLSATLSAGDWSARTGRRSKPLDPSSLTVSKVVTLLSISEAAYLEKDGRWIPADFERRALINNLIPRQLGNTDVRGALIRLAGSPLAPLPTRVAALLALVKTDDREVSKVMSTIQNETFLQYMLPAETKTQAYAGTDSLKLLALKFAVAVKYTPADLERSVTATAQQLLPSLKEADLHHIAGLVEASLAKRSRVLSRALACSRAVDKIDTSGENNSSRK